MDLSNILSGGASFLGSILGATGLGIGRSGMHPQQPSDILREAAQLGVSPLVLLGAGGSLSQGFGASVGDSGSLAGLGQNLARAGLGKADPNPLDENLKRAQADNLDAQTHALLVHSQLRTATLPGTPEYVPGGNFAATGGVPFPTEDPRGLSKGMPEVTRPFFSGDPRHPVYGMGREFGLQFEPPGPLRPITYPALLGSNVASGVGAISDDLRSFGTDVLRYFGWGQP